MALRTVAIGRGVSDRDTPLTMFPRDQVTISTVNNLTTITMYGETYTGTSLSEATAVDIAIQAAVDGGWEIVGIDSEGVSIASGRGISVYLQKDVV